MSKRLELSSERAEYYKQRYRLLTDSGRYKNKQALPEETSHLAMLDDEALFKQVDSLVRNEQLYLCSSFQRKTLIDRTGLPKERLGSIFKQYSGYDNLPAYVTALRLEHSCLMLREEPSLTVRDVAEASGFGDTRYFLRLFREQFGMTPSQYRCKHKASPNATFQV
ncbi:MAG: AraC family transcriptional regulator [Bacteroidaceae bacterium]|nr:AraC family transcriptional regulator [Bacteroidaceae bacterium]